MIVPAMTQTHTKPDAFMWCPAEHASTIASCMKDAGWGIAGVGIPPRSGTKPEMEGVAFFDDPRVGVTESGAQVALFVDASPLDDHTLLKLCERQGMRVLALGPAPAGVHAWTKDASSEHGARVLPLLADSVIHRDAVEAIETLGAVTGASIRMFAPLALGGVPSRLYDAMQLLHRHMGVPEQIDASCSGVKSASEVSLRDLHASLHAHLRYPGAGATISIREGTGGLRRDALLEFESGVLRLTDERFVVVSDSAEVIDRADSKGLDPLVEQLGRATDPRLPAPDHYDRAAVLAMCEAAVLSVRTRQAERPHELLSMMRG